VRGTLALEDRRAGQIAIVLAGDAELRTLNRRWRGLDRATDVLSFGDDADGAAASKRRTVHGDLAISMDRVREQARRFRVTRARELARLVIHGALHLAGLDHHTASERRHMRSREERALRSGRTEIAALRRALEAAPPD
jgi:probable rRNA maturation factor